MNPVSPSQAHRAHSFSSSSLPHAVEVFRRRPGYVRWLWFAAGFVVGDVLMVIALHVAAGGAP